MTKNPDHFVIGSLFQVCVKRIREASSDEFGLGVVGKAFLIEISPEVLKSESVVEDGGVSSWWWFEIHSNGQPLFNGSRRSWQQQGLE
jgi:hypothetical protein